MSHEFEKYLENAFDDIADMTEISQEADIRNKEYEEKIKRTVTASDRRSDVINAGVDATELSRVPQAVSDLTGLSEYELAKLAISSAAAAASLASGLLSGTNHQP
jgi:hypothetical protein